ncbi:hypothetical protein [Archangium sp.]|uniref:hypothetical protein n=1 Tax=Archangium sp. TaxID=1872627 RepID=UPI002D5E713D|nr:hypothetical protein [Archangium sp.]HYO59860.1 hypothetical protein [Archangium sp.]
MALFLFTNPKEDAGHSRPYNATMVTTEKGMLTLGSDQEQALSEKIIGYWRAPPSGRRTRVRASRTSCST